DGRALVEVLAFSPGPEGLFSGGASALSNQVFIGFGVVMILALGFAASFYRRDRGAHRKEWIGQGLLLIGCMAVILVALGMRGPLEGLPYRICRHLIPKYNMIRQTGKIFCLMPFLLALAACFSLTALLDKSRWKWMGGALIAIAMFECWMQVSPTICLLRFEQPAYQAVAEDALQTGRQPHELILPLWPGDSHESSSYEHFVSLYGIRMINGYNPVVKRDYFNNVFRRYESANAGEITEDQIAGLQAMGIEYILLHEDQFPDKASPFPVAFTLQRLLHHPRLDLLKNADRVWAFKIKPAGQTQIQTLGLLCPYIFPSFVVEGERLASNNVPVLRDTAASHDAFARLSTREAEINIDNLHTAPALMLRWMLRLRGQGSLHVGQAIQDVPSAPMEMKVQNPEWHWREIPVSGLAHFSPIALHLAGKTGVVDVDMIMLAAGPWHPIAIGETLSLPASCFFRAGYTDPERAGVVFRMDTEPEGAIFYGPHLPLQPGLYEIELVFSSPAAAGTGLGMLLVGFKGEQQAHSIPVVSGQRARLLFNALFDKPLAVTFDFHRNGDVELYQVAVTRKK
ncbi:MAG: hypothetical protein V2A34_12665, partial [Lentisphaerota bacterium]